MGLIFLEKAKSNLKLCVVNKGDEQSGECGLFCCCDFFVVRLKTRWDSRTEPVFSQETSKSVASDGGTLK